VLVAEIIDLMSKYKGSKAQKLVQEKARKHGVSFRQLWSRFPSKWK